MWYFWLLLLHLFDRLLSFIHSILICLFINSILFSSLFSIHVSILLWKTEEYVQSWCALDRPISWSNMLLRIFLLMWLNEVFFRKESYSYNVADYILQTGGLFFFFIEDWRMVSDYRHIQEVTSIYAEPSGRRLVIVDTKGDGYLYNPVSLDSNAFVKYVLLILYLFFFFVLLVLCLLTGFFAFFLLSGAVLSDWEKAISIVLKKMFSQSWL